MTKEDWEELYKILNSILDDFKINYHQMKFGKTKKVRNRAEYNVNNATDLAKTWITKYPDCLDLMTGEGATGYDKAIVWDEFFLSRYFGHDMIDLLNRIKDKIDSL